MRCISQGSGLFFLCAAWKGNVPECRKNLNPHQRRLRCYTNNNDSLFPKAFAYLCRQPSNLVLHEPNPIRNKPRDHRKIQEKERKVQECKCNMHQFSSDTDTVTYVGLNCTCLFYIQHYWEESCKHFKTSALQQTRILFSVIINVYFVFMWVLCHKCHNTYSISL